MKPRNKVIPRVLAAADLDAELEPRLPIVELAGDHRVLIENHLSVIGYTSQCVCVKVKYGCVCINGSGLTIAKLSKDQLVIIGDIGSIQLSREDRRK